MASYDLVVIGAGPAGEKGAAQAAYFGKRVALVDPNPRPGGIAMSTAGIPTKVLREGAIYLFGLGQSAFAAPTPGVQDAWSLLMARKREVSDFLIKGVERNLLRHRIERVRGSARLLPGRRVEVTKPGGERMEFEAAVILIACGSRPRLLSGIPMDDPDVHDAETILGIERAPSSLVVVGTGAAGCEYASIFAALGVRVTLVTPGSHLLPALDDEMARVLAESFNGFGIRVMPLTKVERVERVDGGLEVLLDSGKKVSAAKVLVAVGRRPNTDALGLVEAGVATMPEGWIQVDASYETSAPGIFAAGDVIGPPGLASFAMEQARVAICRAFALQFKSEADLFRPTYVFSIPEAAAVGMTEEQARKSGAEVEVGRCSFMTNAKARISGFPEGLVKLVFRVPDKRLLGVHIVGELASELIHIGQFVLQDGGTIDRFIDATFAVPSRSEAYKYAAYDGLSRLARRIGESRVLRRAKSALAGTFEAARVVAARRLAPQVRQVTIAAASFTGQDLPAGAEVAVRIPGDDGRHHERHYSVFKHDRTNGTLDICVVLHELGPGSRWASQCREGDALEVSRGTPLPIQLVASVDEHVFLGDETSIAGAEALFRGLPVGTRRRAYIEVPSPEHRWPEDALADPAAVHWVARDGRPGMALMAMLAPELFPSAASTAAYVTGEAWLCSGVASRLVRNCGFLQSAVRAFPFWKWRGMSATIALPPIRV